MNRKQRRAAASVNEPADFVETFNLALSHHEAGRLDEAAKLYQRAMKINPGHALLHNNMGVLYYALGNCEDAIAMQKKAIALDPMLGISHNNMGVALNKLERHEEAVEAFARAIEIEPNNSRALNNMGDSLTKSERFDESIKYLERALAVDPNYAEAKSNMGMALWGKGDLEGAISWLRESLKLAPDLATVRKNLGLVLLLKGDLNESWVEYNYRIKAENAGLRGDPLPIWMGQKLGDRSLFVFSEQGIGDEILYASMIPNLLERGVNVLWDTDERLMPLIKRSFPSIRVIPRPVFKPGMELPNMPAKYPELAAQMPAGTLGQIFRRNLDAFPKEKTGYLVADRLRSASLRARLGLQFGEKLVGMSWISKNLQFGRHKSTTLSDWAEIFKTPGVRFVDLQYGDTSEERAALQSQYGVTLSHIEGLDLRNDMDGMAALTAACDLVITVSNTTAHVAGALGIPTWVFVPLGGGKLWYWGVEKETTPWYPAISIIRQVDRESWRSTLKVASDRLRALIEQ